MAILEIRKKSTYTWLHIDSELGEFILSQFYFSEDGLNFQIVEQGQSKRRIYPVTSVLVYDDVLGTPVETFTSILDLSLRLEELYYPAFDFSNVAPYDPTASHYRGKYASATITLNDGVGQNGDYWQATVNETVDLGSGNIVLKVGDYLHYNGYDNVWEKWIDNNQSGGGGGGDTDSLPEGSTNLYFTLARVLATALAGLSSTAGTFTSSSTILEAFGKVKYLIDNIASIYQTIITAASWGTFINGLTAKTTPVDADFFGMIDSAASNVFKKVSWVNIKATLKAYFDLIYSPYKFRVVTLTNTAALTGTTTSTFMVSDILIPANTVTPGNIIVIRARGIRSVVTSSNTGINFSISPTAGQTVVSGDITSIHNFGNMIISATNTVGQRKTEVFVKASNLCEVINSATFNDDTQSSSKLELTATDWTVNQYFYIYANNAQTTTSTLISGYELFVK